MPLDPQLQALMNASAPDAAGGMAAAPSPEGAVPSTAGAGDVLDPQLQALMDAPSAPTKKAAAAVPSKSGASMRDYLAGPADLVGSALANTGASVVGGLAGLIDSPFYKAGLTNIRPDSLVKGAQSFAYEPRTQFAKNILGGISKPLAAATQGAGDVVQEAAPSWLGLGSEGSAVAGGLASGVPTGLMSLLGGEAAPEGPNTINVGLNVGSKTAFAPQDVFNALRNRGVKVKSSSVAQSNTEPTVIARTARPMSPDQANGVAGDLSQDAIAQSGPAGSNLFGPQAAAWGPFNPQFFLDMQGKPLAPPPANPELAAGSQLGLRFTPEEAGAGLGSRAMQSLSGSAKLERDLAKKNAPAVNAAVGRQIGLPEGTVATPKTLDQAAVPFNAVYDAAGRTGTVDLADLDPTLKPFISDARSQLRLPDSDLSALDAQDLVTTVRQLRAMGFANRNAPRYMPSQKLLGKNQLDAANALDNALDDHIQEVSAQPGSTVPADLMQQLKDARQGLAQIASARQALRPGGNFFAGSFAKQLGRNVPLSGEMKTIGEAYGRANRSLQDVNKIRDAGPFNVMDYLAGDLGLSHPMGWLGLPFAATIFGRPLMRAYLGSKLYQRGLTGLPKPAPTPPTFPGLIQAGRGLPFLAPQEPTQPTGQ